MGCKKRGINVLADGSGIVITAQGRPDGKEDRCATLLVAVNGGGVLGLDMLEWAGAYGSDAGNSGDAHSGVSYVHWSIQLYKGERRLTVWSCMASLEA